jgi:GrpB-like predicted nucleotidyltransferase (UPF0157 family)
MLPPAGNPDDFRPIPAMPVNPSPREEVWDSLGADSAVVELVPHRDEWEGLYRSEAERILSACSGRVTVVEHIGSTAIPGLSAKPILDLMPGIARLEDGPPTIPSMETLGYTCRGEHGIPGRLYFEMVRGGRRVAHAHMFVVGTVDWERHILFRDYLRAHPETARAYGELKMTLAARHRNDRAAYTDAKSDFIDSIVARARG